MSETSDNEDIDSEALQAQFDLSLSLVHRLASSWVEPNKLPKSTHVSSEKELQDYMRRPPRLGVGAPIPESIVSSRETEQLKKRLQPDRGNKRQRIEEQSNKSVINDEDEEDESRAGAIRKKAKIDIFSLEKKRKKRRNDHTRNEISSTSTEATKTSTQVTGDQDMDTTPPASPSPTQPLETSQASHEQLAISTINGIPSTSKDTTHSIPTITNGVDLMRSPSSTPSSPGMNRYSVLNLTGPPQDAMSKSKRRRKRRKKKNDKTGHIAQDGQHAASTTADV